MEQQFLIQSTAPIAHGSSGGPLINGRGQVVGITSSLLADTPGIYFSVGIGDLKRLLRTPQLLAVPFSQWAVTAKPKDQEGGNSEQAVRALIKDKKYVDARTQLQPLLEKHPNDGTLHTLMGIVADDLGDIQTALTEFARSTSLDPRDAEAHGRYAIALLEAKKFASALNEVKTAKTLNPETPDGLVAMILYANANYVEAAAVARTAFSKNSKDELSLEVITGTDYHDKPDEALWRQDASQLVDIDKDAIWVLIAKAFDEFRAKHRENGISALQDAKKDGFPDSVPYILLASMYAGELNLEQAESEIASGLAYLPADKPLLSTGVFVALLRHDRRKADERIAELQRNGEAKEEASASCLYYYATNQAPLALRACERTIRGERESGTAYSNYGWAALDANQFPLALTQYAKAAELFKDHNVSALQEVDLAWGMIITKYYSGDTRTATEALALLRKTYPAATTVEGLQRLPLVWSDTTLTRIRYILQNVPN